MPTPGMYGNGLLGAVLAQRAAQNAAAQGQPAQPPLQTGNSIWDRLAVLFAGRQDPRLGAGANKMATQQGLLQAGLAMMLASGPAASRPQLLQILAQGALAGQAGGASARNQAQMEQSRQRLQDLFAGGDVPTREALDAILRESLLSGDYDSARIVAEVLKSMGQELPQRGPNLGTFERGDKRYWYDPQTGEVVREMDLPPETARPSTVRPQSVLNADTGETVFGRWDGTQWLDESGQPFNAVPMTTASEGERKAAFFVPLAEQALGQVDMFEGTPDRLTNFVAKRNWNEVVPEDMQLLRTAGQALGDAYLRITSGAAIKEEEVEMYMNTYLPAPGDTPATLAFKRELRATFIAGLRTLAQRAMRSPTGHLGMSGNDGGRAALEAGKAGGGTIDSFMEN